MLIVVSEICTQYKMPILRAGNDIFIFGIKLSIETMMRCRGVFIKILRLKRLLLTDRLIKNVHNIKFLY